MKYSKLRELAAGMDETRVNDSLRSLLADERFAAVIRLVQDQKELSADASAQIAFANNAGCLAHAAGVRYGMLELEGRFKQLCEPPKRRGQAAPTGAH